jgi:DNA-3-methyladenine glycosylase
VKAEFYARDVCVVARELIGCIVGHGQRAGVIVETEAYHESEPACHAFIGVTPRTRTLYAAPGCAYIYRSYGIHAMLNAVAEIEGVGAAVLIRALQPLTGIEHMRERRGVFELEQLCSGPGRLTQALGIGLELNGIDLARGPVTISPRDPGTPAPAILASTRVGITKAVELPWRFASIDTRFVSRPRPRREEFSDTGAITGRSLKHSVGAR